MDGLVEEFDLLWGQVYVRRGEVAGKVSWYLRPKVGNTVKGCCRFIWLALSRLLCYMYQWEGECLFTIPYSTRHGSFTFVCRWGLHSYPVLGLKALGERCK